MIENLEDKQKNLKEPLFSSGGSKDLEKQGQRKKSTKSASSRRSRQSLEKMTVTNWEANKRIFVLAIFPIIGMIFHPAYHICNSILLG